MVRWDGVVRRMERTGAPWRRLGWNVGDVEDGGEVRDEARVEDRIRCRDFGSEIDVCRQVEDWRFTSWMASTGRTRLATKPYTVFITRYPNSSALIVSVHNKRPEALRNELPSCMYSAVTLTKRRVVEWTSRDAALPSF